MGPKLADLLLLHLLHRCVCCCCLLSQCIGLVVKGAVVMAILLTPHCLACWSIGRFGRGGTGRVVLLTTSAVEQEHGITSTPTHSIVVTRISVVMVFQPGMHTRDPFDSGQQTSHGKAELPGECRAQTPQSPWPATSDWACGAPWGRCTGSRRLVRRARAWRTRAEHRVPEGAVRTGRTIVARPVRL